MQSYKYLVTVSKILTLKKKVVSCIVSDKRNNILLQIHAQNQNLEGLTAFVFFRLSNTKIDFSRDASNVLSQSQTEIRAHPEEGIGQHQIPGQSLHITLHPELWEKSLHFLPHPLYCHHSFWVGYLFCS